MKKFFRNSNFLIGVAILSLISCIFFVGISLLNHDGIEQARDIKGTETSLFVTRNGTQLQLFGQPYTFTGVNVYSAATLYGSNAGCGGMVDDLDSLFSSLRPNSIVRFWGWQGSMAINTTTKQLDWSGIDRVLAAASRHGQRVIISLGDQAGTCDGGLWKDSSWYNGGFQQVYNPNGLTPLSYWEYVQQIVQRYKDSTTIAMWELINEPEASNCAVGYSGVGCYGHQICDSQAAVTSLRYFFDTVGGEMKRIDPNHLIESGVIGTGQCGADNWNYQYIHESPAIDVASYHDYNSPDSPMPGDPWNGLQIRLNQMKTIQKPLIIGEVGMLAQDNASTCMNFATRRDKIAAKMNTQFPAGVAGYIPWSWASANGGVCNYDIPPGDPLLTLLHDYPLREVIPPPTPTGIIIELPTVTLTPVVTAIPITPTPPPVPDTTAPSVSIISPIAANGVLRNTTVTISVNASDNVGVAKVVFYVNNALLCTINVAPYNCNWKVIGKKGANYTIQATASDAVGNTSSAFTIVVAK